MQWPIETRLPLPIQGQAFSQSLAFVHKAIALNSELLLHTCANHTVVSVELFETSYCDPGLIHH